MAGLAAAARRLSRPSAGTLGSGGNGFRSSAWSSGWASCVLSSKTSPARNPAIPGTITPAPERVYQPPQRQGQPHEQHPQQGESGTQE